LVACGDLGVAVGGDPGVLDVAPLAAAVPHSGLDFNKLLVKGDGVLATGPGGPMRPTKTATCTVHVITLRVTIEVGPWAALTADRSFASPEFKADKVRV